MQHIVAKPMHYRHDYSHEELKLVVITLDKYLISLELMQQLFQKNARGQELNQGKFLFFY